MLKSLASESQLAADLLTKTNDLADVAKDSRFPSRLIEDAAYFSSDRAFAMWDADNQLSVGYQGKMSVYLAGLTLFAIALYLLGQSLGVEGFLATRILSLAATFFAIVGACMMFVTSVSTFVPPWTAVHVEAAALPTTCGDVFKSYEEKSQNARYQAAVHYACGRHLERLAREPAEYEAAAQQFALATAYRPGFAIASAAHAAADQRAASPQRNADYPSLPPADMSRLQRDVDEQQAAVDQLLDQGFTNPSLVSSLGYNLYVRGLLKSNMADVEAGAKLIDDGLDAYNRYAHAQGWAELNQALVLAARGRFDEAETHYHDLATLRPNLTTAEMALGAMTDLEFLKPHCRNLLTAAQCIVFSKRMPQFKEEISNSVQDWWPNPVASTQTVRLKTVVADSAQVTPGAAAWRAHIAGPVLAGEQLLAVWYHRDPTWNVWVALPELQEAPTKIDVAGNAASFSAALPASNFQSCLDGGEYRVEFYRQGKRAGKAAATNELYDYVPNFDPRLNLAACTPPGWTRNDQTSQAGTATLMYPPDHHSGLLLARRDDPEPIVAAGADSISGHELSEVMHGTLQYAPNADPTCAAPPGWRRTWYTIRGHSVVVQTDVDSDGEIYEGFFIGLGPDPDPAQCAIASSLVELP